MNKKYYENIVKTAQMQFRLFLTDQRETRGLSQSDLSEKLGCTTQYIKKLEGSEPSRVANSIGVLKQFADFGGMEVEAFVDILLGNVDESGKPSKYALEIVKDISRLPTSLQTLLTTRILKDPVKLKEYSGVINFMLSKASKVKKELYKEIETMSETHAKSHLLFIKSMKQEGHQE